MALLDEADEYAETSSRAPRWKLPFKAGALLQSLPHIEAVFVVVLSIATGVGYDLARFGQLGEYNHHFGLGIAATALFSTSAYARGLCPCPEQRMASQIKEIALIWTAVFVCLVVVALAMNLGDLFSREFIMLFFVVGLLGIVLVRWSARQIVDSLNRADVIARPQVVFVARSEDLALSNILQAIKASGCDVCQTLTLPASSSDGALLNCIDGLIDYVRRRPVDEILVAAGWGDITLIQKITARLCVVPVPVTLLPDQSISALLERPLVNIAGRRAIALQRAPLSVPQLLAKRLFDLGVSMVLLSFLLAPLALIALLIALDSKGPVLFCQRRSGLNGRPFKIYKFRTMTILQDGPIVQQAIEGDPRVTRIGRILRRFSIDELPQLWNVLKGDMSLVGPRPHALAHDSEYSRIISFYSGRHNVKPGITGWAQINGWRGATPHVTMMIRRVEHDMWYVHNWTVWLDIKILLLTIPRVWTGRNAY